MIFVFVSLSALSAVSAELSSPAPYLAGPPSQSRIVGGTIANINEVPWQAAFLGQSGGKFFFSCGGTIISSRHILTAAHCFSDAPLFPVTWVRVGSSYWNSGGTLVQAERALNHPEYNILNLDRDIGIVFLASRIFIGGGNVASVPLPQPADSLSVGTIVRVSGWGAMWPNGSISDHLLRVDVPVIDWKTCRNRYLERRTIPGWQHVDVTSNMFCAGLLDVGGQDACQGDSGGPAVANGFIFGIISWGYSCAHYYWPGVYAFVPPSTGWIVDNIAEDDT